MKIEACELAGDQGGVRVAEVRCRGKGLEALHKSPVEHLRLHVLFASSIAGGASFWILTVHHPTEVAILARLELKCTHTDTPCLSRALRHTREVLEAKGQCEWFF